MVVEVVSTIEQVQHISSATIVFTAISIFDFEKCRVKECLHYPSLLL